MSDRPPLYNMPIVFWCRWLAPFFAGLLFLCLAQAAQADGISVPGIAPIGASNAAVKFPPTSGGGSPTWTAQTSAANASCGFVTTCSITGVPVTSGLVVAVVGGGNQAGSASTVSSLTVCGTSLTLVGSPSVASGTMLLGLFYGTVTSGR
jgi:hypothetical protein